MKLPSFLACSPDERGWLRDFVHLKRMETATATKPLAEHVHEAGILEFVFLAAGHQTYKVNGDEYRLKGGDVLMLREGDKHGTGGLPEEKRLCYWIGVRLPKRTRGFLDLPPPLARTMLSALQGMRRRQFPGSARLQHLIDTCFEMLESSAPGSAVRVVEIHCQLTQIVVEIAACAGRVSSPRPSKPLSNALAFIEQRLTERLTVRDVASHLGISRRGLLRLFKQEAGCAPHDYILHRKIDLAQDRLSASEPVHVTTVAYDLGFSSSQHFAAVFKRYTGISPAVFRLLRPAAEGKSLSRD